MNILFLLFHGLSTASGISKKIIYQIQGLKASGHQVALCHYEIRDDGHRVRMIDDTLLEDYGSGKLAPLRKRTSYNAIAAYALQHGIHLIYVRSFHNANPFTIVLFRRMRKVGIKVVMEIPTYPYDSEYNLLPLAWKAELLIDKCFRKQLARHTDAIVTFSAEQQIFGQTTISISNGIDFNSIPVKHPSTLSTQDIHLIGVAEIHYWHGYDRIIAGLGEYYLTSPSRNVHLHIVGGIGAIERETFRLLTEKYKLAEYITFYGQRQNQELQAIFDKCSFGIGSLGRHRSGIDRIKTLKNREYAARGIPFIYSETDDDFDNMPYILKAPANDTPVNIQQILDFEATLHMSPQEIRNTILHLSWKEQMQKVTDHLFKAQQP